MPDQLPPGSYPGERLGLPESGSGSLAKLGRRVWAILIDWACAVLISISFFDYDPLATILIFVLVQTVFIRRSAGALATASWACACTAFRTDGRGCGARS